MAFDLNRKEVEKQFVALETVFNWAGYLPYTAGYSAPLRAAYASLQVIGGVSLAAGRAIQALTAPDERSRDKQLKKSYHELVYAAHGVANYVRSEVERIALPFRLVTAVWDIAGYRIKYSVEAKKDGQFLTMDMVHKNIKWIRERIDYLMGTGF